MNKMFGDDFTVKVRIRIDSGNSKFGLKINFHIFSNLIFFSMRYLVLSLFYS